VKDAPEQKKKDREDRIRRLLAQMTLDEKIAQMTASTNLLYQAIMVPRYNLFTYDSGPNRRMGIPAKKFTDGPRGVTMGRSTCFPVSMARGATWDTDLEERVGDAMGREARAQGANYYGGVCINLLRHPGWGRAQETFGEDPHHLGAMGAAMVRGLQRHVMACIKHFACNSIEESRFFVDVEVDERTLREVYLPHFKTCVDEGVASVMSAYNRVNGEYCGQNARLLKEILKEEWGFEGFVVSDFFWGVRDGGASARAGLDIEMNVCRFYGRKLKEKVLNGEVPEADIEDSVLRILRQKYRFADIFRKTGYDKGDVAGEPHTRLALEAAQKSIVLLKNEGDALPLDRAGIGSIAVFGDRADKADLGDMGSSRVRPPRVVTPLEGIRNRAGGKVTVLYDKGKDLSRARSLARDVDAVVVVAGLTWPEEGEYLPIPLIRFGGDRLCLDLPAGQEQLIRAVASENRRCIVVLRGGSAITLESWKGEVPAILMAWYPGMEGGHAIADILFGDVNPSGKLPLTVPESVDQLPSFDNRAKRVEYGYYHGYRHMQKQGLDPAFPFGFGLSYTAFRYDLLSLDKRVVDRDGSVTVRVEVSNVGDRAGEEVVQIYVGCVGSKVHRPPMELKGFGRLSLAPGETGTLEREIRVADLAYYDVSTKGWVVEEIEYQVFAGPSSRQEDLHLGEAFRVRASDSVNNQ
jgi:beta-glucosidase